MVENTKTLLSLAAALDLASLYEVPADVAIKFIKHKILLYLSSKQFSILCQHMFRIFPPRCGAYCLSGHIPAFTVSHVRVEVY